MKTILILTMHGMPPKDFPRRELGEYFSLHMQMENSPRRIIILTPMITRGGDHAEEDIPAELETLRKTYPEIEFRYAWPFDPVEVTRFLAGQVKRFA